MRNPRQTPNWVPDLIAAVGLLLQVYIAVFESSGGITFIGILFFLVATLPYAGAILIARQARAPFLGACAAAGVLLLQGWILAEYLLASGGPTASTLAFVFGSMASGFVGLPLGLLAGVVVLKLWPDRPQEHAP